MVHLRVCTVVIHKETQCRQELHVLTAFFFVAFSVHEITKFVSNENSLCLYIGHNNMFCEIKIKLPLKMGP